ncbi:hypothetical protein [Streptomyces avermitilis]|uniref:hypothetical protein n=1 Tax=Streptomyces avermitilis TaxID=33903 RepID=UPI0036995EE2
MDALRSVTAHVLAAEDVVSDAEPRAVGEALPAGGVEEPVPAGRDAPEVGALEEDPAALSGTPDGEPAVPAASDPPDWHPVISSAAADMVTIVCAALRIPVLYCMKSPEVEVQVSVPHRHSSLERAVTASGVYLIDRL